MGKKPTTRTLDNNIITLIFRFTIERRELAILKAIVDWDKPWDLDGQHVSCGNTQWPRLFDWISSSHLFRASCRSLQDDLNTKPRKKQIYKMNFSSRNERTLRLLHVNDIRLWRKFCLSAVSNTPFLQGSSITKHFKHKVLSVIFKSWYVVHRGEQFFNVFSLSDI